MVRNSKDEVNGRSSKKPDIRKDSSLRTPGKAKASDVRRLAREASESRQKTPSPQSQRKSLRIEKGTPPLTPNMKPISDRLGKNNTPSPVRRSDRGKKILSPCSSGLRKSAKELTLPERKRNKEKKLIQMRMESEKAEVDLEAVGMKRKKLNARSYLALFKRQRIVVPDGDVGLGGLDKLFDVCGDNSIGIGSEPLRNGDDNSGECSRRMVGELRDERIDIDKASDGAPQKSNCSLKDCDEDLQNNGIVDSSCRDNVLDEPSSKYSDTSLSVEETLDCPEGLLTNCSSTENMDAPDSDSSTCLAKTGDGSQCSDINENCVPSEEDAPSISPKCENCNFLGSCVLCSKNKRVGYSAPEQELCSCSFTVDEHLGIFSTCKGRSDHEAAVTSETAEKCDSRHLLTEMPADSQMDDHGNACALCNGSGELLYCEGKGCGRFYHLCCLDPPQMGALPGVWHCPQCVKRKLLFGVHSVSEGVESIWDVREVEVSKVKGVRQMQYLVKYKGLAHIHNHWVPEKQLLLENSCLVSNYIEKDQMVRSRWSTEWTLPHRLLRKRAIQDNIYIASSSVISVCNYEWLVKWHGLDYDHATWELDNADCLSSPLAQNLMKGYETRCRRAKQDVNQYQKGSKVELSELPASQSLVKDNTVLKNVNKLRECMFKCQNAVVFDDQERAVTTMFFLQSVSESCRPFLIITSSSSLPQWEAEFTRLVPSVDVVVYSGNRDTRKGIRASEFYDEGGCLMLQVLLSSIEAVLEDMDRLVSIKWEAIVIDDYQQFGIANDHEQIKMLPTESRILLVSGQIKDTTSEYLKVLSLLESHCDLDKLKGLKLETNDHLCRLKDRLSHFIAYGSNCQLTKFLEYWVPVQISNYQLEQYCARLLDNSVHLRSNSRNDRVGALRDILLTARKCCVHPYLLDSSVQERLVAEQRSAELLDIGIKASGKLELLDVMLTEIKTRGLRVVVLFQLIIGLGKASTGNILEDFLMQRFGPDAYERVDSLVLPSEKQAAVNRFNKKETGQFVFLLENRACSPTIKLSSLDVVVVYDSDWNPANDLRALQKLSIGSKVEQIKIFRLYSSFTVEERALILAKKNLNLDNNLQNFGRTTSDTLLSWGAAHLFSKLDEYHADGNSTSDYNFSSGQLLSSEVTREFQAILSGSTDSNSVISKVTLGVGSYSTNIPLLGEAKVQLKDGEEPHVFWRDLLDGRNYIWKHIRDPSPRNRKRIRYFERSPSKLASERDDVVKKRKKMVDDKLDSALVQVGLGSNQPSQITVTKEGPSTIKACNQSENFQNARNTSKNNPNGLSGHNSFVAGVSEGMPEEEIVSSDERKTLYSSLQAKMMRLCQVLKFSEDVTATVLRLLEYVIKNRDVNSDSHSVVQALQISLCWIAASIKKIKIDKKDSLLLAKQLLNYQCTDEQAHSVYLILKEMYSQCQEKIVHTSNIRSVPGEGKEKAAASDSDANIKKLQKKTKKLMKRLKQRHHEQLQEVHEKWDKERIKLETDHKLESAFIRSVHGQGSVGMDKLKLLDNELAVKMEELNFKKEMALKHLEAKQLADMDEQRKASQWLTVAEANSSGSAAANGPQSLGPQPEEHVVEGPQPSEPPDEVTVNLQNEVGVSSSAVIQNVNQSKHSSDNGETVLASPVEEINASKIMPDKGRESASSDALVSQECGTNEAASGDSQNPRQQPLVHSERTKALSDCSDLSPLQVQQDKIDQSLAPVGLQHLDQPALGNQSTLQTGAELINTVNPGPSNHEETNKTATPILSTHETPVTDETANPVPSNNEAPTIENSECNKSSVIEENDQRRSSAHQTAQPGGTEVLPNESVPQSGETSDIHNNHINIGPVTQNDVATSHVVAPIAGRPNHAVLQLGNDASGSSHPYSSADPLQNELDNLKSGETSDIDNNHINTVPVTQNDVATSHVVARIAGRPSHAVLQLGNDASGSSHPYSSADPLQNELDNLKRESEQLEKYHKDLESKLKSDCDKEIQEIITQIRNKYEAKLKENEAEFRLKKNELEKNHVKVYMNKILAAAFRFKCSNPRPALVPGTQQGVPSSFVQHMHQLSTPPPTRPSSCQPALTQPITPQSRQTSHQLSLSHLVRPPIFNQHVPTPPVIRSPTIDQNVSSPPVQAVQTAAALFSSTPPSRPPVISTITPSRNSRPGGELRSAAPHLQSFRPSVPVSASCATSPLVPQFRPPLQRPPSQPLQTPALTNLVVSQSMAARSNNPSPAAATTGLVVDVDRQAKNKGTTDLPEICSTFGSLELSDLEILSTVEGNQVPSSVGADIVCLSDDD